MATQPMLEHELQSAAWQKFKALTETRLDMLRSKNDNMALTERETATLRGRIAECKRILGLGKPGPEVEASDNA